MLKRKMNPTNSNNNKELQKNLLSWYSKNHRPLPWRKPIVPDFSLSSQYSKLFIQYQSKSSKDRDVKKDAELLNKLHEKIESTTPYGIWVSEIMSQQTRIDVVVPFWQRWMLRFPDSKALADAPFEEVQKYWSGLGFYRRCDLLHRGAKALNESSTTDSKKDTNSKKGALPTDSVESLKKIPGIGDYTSAAIGSIAFNHPDCPSVDGNVLRVTARLFGQRDINVKEKSDIAKLTELAKSLMKNVETTGDFNQGMMELGATVCRPNGEPLCEKCPVSKFCEARKMKASDKFPDIEEIEGVIPLKSEAMKKQEVKGVVCVLYCSTMNKKNDEEEIKVLIFKRPDAGAEKGQRKLLSGFWSFPMITTTSLNEKLTSKKVSQIFSTGMKKENATKAKSAASSASDSFNLSTSFGCVVEALKNKKNEFTFLGGSEKKSGVRHIFSHIDYSASVCKVEVCDEKELKDIAKKVSAAKIVSLSQLREHDHVAISNLDEKIAHIAFPAKNRRRQREE